MCRGWCVAGGVSRRNRGWHKNDEIRLRKRCICCSFQRIFYCTFTQSLLRHLHRSFVGVRVVCCHCGHVFKTRNWYSRVIHHACVRRIYQLQGRRWGVGWLHDFSACIFELCRVQSFCGATLVSVGSTQNAIYGLLPQPQPHTLPFLNFLLER